MYQKLICPKCSGSNVVVQVVGITRTKKKGMWYRLIIGWRLEPMFWIMTFGLMLIVKLFRSRKVETVVEGHAVCQSCGNTRKI